jgi:Ca-activated chloride channel family protein
MQPSRILAAPLFVLILFTGIAGAQPDTNDDRTLSPYFFVKSDDPDLDRLPLKSTSVKVDISGVIADVQVTQTYRNEGKKPLEAVYIFPGSTRAAVYGMKMTIGERTVTARIRKREDARRAYEQAREEGKSASLLEQQRPNVFQMNVANILSSDVITVELRYTELLVPEDGIYEFVYPTVVGPRYSNQPAGETPPLEDWVRNPYLHQGEPPTYTFNLGVRLSAGLPIQEATCPSHKVDVRYLGPSVADLRLDPSEKTGGNRDFILKYRLSGNRIQTGLLLFQGEKENFFLAMIQPPERVTPEEIPPREYLFIVDVSGSMHGFPLDLSKKLLRDLVGNLRPTDRFNLLLFAGGSSLLSEQSLPATPANIQRALTTIERERGGGGTELLPALERALALTKAEGFSRSVVIVTDGYVTVEEEAFDLIRKSLGQANLFAFGIGTSVNRHLIDGMARVGMGEPFVITRPEEAPEKAKRFRELIQSPVLTDVEIRYQGFEAYDVEPPAIPDVLAHRPVIVFGKWKGAPRGVIEVRGKGGTGPFTQEMDVSQVSPYEGNAALRYLWARHRIALLSDYICLHSTDRRVEEVTDLGLNYNLLTAYTSFVAVDTAIRAQGENPVTVRQPLPLPSGVSDLAVGRGRLNLAKDYAPASPQVLRGPGDLKTHRTVSEEKAETEKRKDASKGPSLVIGEIIVSEGLAENEVRALLEKVRPDLQRCYASTGEWKAGMKATFLLTIGQGGEVKEVVMKKEGSLGRSVEWCVTRRLQAIRFPVPKGVKHGRVSVTLQLK